MSKLNGHANEPDLIDAGFHRLGKELVKDHPPKIQWGLIYREWADEDKVAYLEKLAAAMNHAAYLIQNERNQLGELCELKESQITALKAALDQNNAMIQGEITKMNAERQQYNGAIAGLNKQLKEAKRGGLD